MAKKITNQKHKFLSKLKDDLSIRSTSVVVIAITTLSMGIGAALVPSMPAFADSDYYTCDQETPAECIYDTGLHNEERVGSPTSYIGEAPEGTYNGHEEYELKINDGSDCLDQSTTVGQNGVYDEACSNASNKLWARITQSNGTYMFENVWMSAQTGETCVLTSHFPGSGDDLVTLCDQSANAYDQWSLTGV